MKRKENIDLLKEIPFFCSAIGNIIYGVYILMLSSITIIIIKRIPIIKNYCSKE